MILKKECDTIVKKENDAKSVGQIKMKSGAKLKERRE